MRRSTASASTIRNRTSTARTTAERRGQEIVRGLPDNAPVNTVREDPDSQGVALLRARSGRCTSRSTTATTGSRCGRTCRPRRSATWWSTRTIWSSARTADRSGFSTTSPRCGNSPRKRSAADVHLFRPAATYRVRRNVATDTPIPPDEPLAPNPPDGAVIDYRLKADAVGPVTLEILDSTGKLVRRFASTDMPEKVDPQALQIDPRWIRPARILPAAAGSHRFVWDLHYPPPEGRAVYPISAIWRDTPSGPLGPAVMPGTYTVRLTVGGKSIEQPLVVKMDPRVTTPAAGLKQQFELSMQCYDGMDEGAGHE